MHFITGVTEYGGITNSRLHPASPDWEKAFDDEDGKEMFNAMHRMGVHGKRIRLVEALNENTQLVVDESTCRKTPHTALRK